MEGISAPDIAEFKRRKEIELGISAQRSTSTLVRSRNPGPKALSSWAAGEKTAVPTLSPHGYCMDRTDSASVTVDNSRGSY